MGDGESLPLRHIVNLLGGAAWAQIQLNIHDHCIELVGTHSKLWATGYLSAILSTCSGERHGHRFNQTFRTTAESYGNPQHAVGYRVSKMMRRRKTIAHNHRVPALENG